MRSVTNGSSSSTCSKCIFPFILQIFHPFWLRTRDVRRERRQISISIEFLVWIFRVVVPCTYLREMSSPHKRANVEYRVCLCVRATWIFNWTEKKNVYESHSPFTVPLDDFLFNGTWGEPLHWIDSNAQRTRQNRQISERKNSLLINIRFELSNQ